jgi:hypothetical protein
MAGKAKQNDATPGKASGIMGLLVKACYGLGLVCVIVLFLAGVDFHVVNLTHSLGIPALGAFALFVLCAALGGIAAMLSGGKETGQLQADTDALAAMLEARMQAVVDKFSAHFGAETEAIKKERDELATELEQIRQAEEEKRLAEEQRRLEEFEELKQQNLLLQEHLRKAGQALAATMAGTRADDDDEQGDDTQGMAEAV